MAEASREESEGREKSAECKDIAHVTSLYQRPSENTNEQEEKPLH
jgi:hypothetical protein